MKNKLIDLNNLLFEQMERLMDEELTKEQIQTEIERTRAVSNIASTIIQNGALALKAEEMRQEYGAERAELPKFLEG